MSEPTNSLSEYDQIQITQKAYNPQERTLAVGSFVAGKVGYKVVRAIVSATIDDYSYYDGSTLLQTLRVTYDDSNHTNVNQVERTV